MRYSIIWIWSALVSFVCAQDQFTSPKGGKDSWWTQKWTNGDTMNIAWQGSWQGPDDSPGQADLWITWFDNEAFSQLIKSDIKMGNPGNLDWKIDIPSATIQTDSRFLFKFLPHVNPTVYQPKDNHASSVGFDILLGSTSSQSRSSSATSTTFSISTVSSTQSSPPTSSTPPALAKLYKKPKKKKNIGAIAGGVLGGLVFIIVLLVIALMVLRSKKRRNAEKQYELGAGKALMSPSYQQEEVKYAHAAPVPVAEQAPVELADTHRTHELGTEAGDRR